ncbi:hypothetical protein GR927_49515 [Mycolicibacterium sp. 3033]|nr:hypothetical protein [Mycolicibacterium aurantiacum]
MAEPHFTGSEARDSCPPPLYPRRDSPGVRVAMLTAAGLGPACSAL